MQTVARKRFTAEEYEDMVRVGILKEDDRVELIDGEIVAMTPIGLRHGAATARATRTLVRVVGDLAIVLPQSTVRLDLYNMPEPDFTLLRPRDDFYVSRRPGPADILLAIELADSSIRYDRGLKMRTYARLGIREYWLADLKRSRLISHRHPVSDTYRTVQEHDPDASLAPLALPECVMPIRGLLAG